MSAMSLDRRIVQCLILLGGAGYALRGADAPTKIAMISYGDYIVRAGNVGSKAAIETSFRTLKDAGFTHVYWRLFCEGHPMEDMVFFSRSLQLGPSEDVVLKARREVENTPYAWNPHEIAWPIAVAHRLGLKFYAWIVPYNEGAPPGAHAEYGVGPRFNRMPYFTVADADFPYQSRFLYEHPQFQSVDRTGKRHHYGVLEWAYPEARQYWIKDAKLILDRYDVDGIYMDTRTECMSPSHADEFGFNEPVVKEFQRRHGVNILEEDFDVEQWRALRGEYFTLFLKELSALIHGRGKLFSLGTARGDYIGFPLGNMKLEWRTWIRERIVDEFHLDEYGWAWGKQGYGYVTDFATGRGLKPLATAVAEDYGPLCKQSGVKLYFKCLPYRSRPQSEPCCQSRATPSGVKLSADWCDRMARMPEFDGTVGTVPFQ